MSQLLRSSLARGSKPLVFRFQGKANQPLVRQTVGTHGGDHVGRFYQVQDQRITGLGDLLGFNSPGLVVTRGGRADEPVAVGENPLTRRQHVVGGDHGNNLGTRWIIDLHRAADDDNIVTRLKGRFGQRTPHPAARRIGEISYRVEVLARGG